MEGDHAELLLVGRLAALGLRAFWRSDGPRGTKDGSDPSAPLTRSDPAPRRDVGNTEPPSTGELERFFFLDDADKRLVERRRGDRNRVGFALQLGTVRFLGTFLAYPTDVPTEVVDYVAGQVGAADASCLKGYLGQRATRFEHTAEIAAAYGYRDFGDAEAELERWVDDRAWTTGEAATQRLWDLLAAMVTPAQARMLELLLEVPDGAKVSDLERLRRGPTTPSGKAMVAALDRVAELAGLGFGPLNLDAVLQRRVTELARWGVNDALRSCRRR